MANLRVSLGRQVSEISAPKRFAFRNEDLNIIPPDSWDETDSLIIDGGGNIHGGEASIPQPSCDVASMVIPLQAYLSSVPLIAIINTEAITIDISFQPVSFELYDSQIINTLSIPTILTVPITFEKIGILGMNYADKHWHKISYPEEEKLHQIKQEKLGEQNREGEFVDLKKRGRKQKNQQSLPSVWDLLFAILQPPLTLSQSKTLPLPYQLYPYQPQGIKFLMDNEHALLADDMGTGKTVMTIVSLKILIQQAKVHHVLILCPSSILSVWKSHLDEWAPELITYLIRSPQREVRKSLWKTPMHVYITTYDMFRGDLENDVFPRENMSRFDIVILDEAHHIKNTRSSRHRAIKKLHPRIRWALTGTPVQNKLDDLAAIFEFVYPGYLTAYDLYPERIMEKIKPHFLRRRKKDVLPDLPPKQRQPFKLELDPEQEIAYRQAEKGIQEEFSALGNKVSRVHIFEKIMILKQLCNFAPRKQSSPKTDLLKEQIEEIIEGDNKVIVFSQFIGEGISKLEKLLEPYGVAKIIGGQTDSIRKIEIEKFKKNKDIPILIASVHAGGEGLNLIEASYVVHFDHWWNPAVMWQAEDRVHRVGQTKGVNVYSYWMKDTIDDRIQQKLKEKGLLFEQVVDGLAESGIDELFSTDDLLDILGIKVEVSKKPTFDVKAWQYSSLQEIKEKLYEITPSDFEFLVRELMHFLGYPNVKVTGKSHDGGIDVLSTRNTTNGIERVAAQCKRYRGNVHVSAARDFFGAISNDKSIRQGFLVTTGEFTPDCLQFCQSSGMIRAISGLELAKYVRQFGLHS